MELYTIFLFLKIILIPKFGVVMQAQLQSDKMTPKELLTRDIRINRARLRELIREIRSDERELASMNNLKSKMREN